jgi:hypothetical protein
MSRSLSIGKNETFPATDRKSQLYTAGNVVTLMFTRRPHNITKFVWAIHANPPKFVYKSICTYSVYRERLDVIGTFGNFQFDLEISEIFFRILSLIRRTHNVSVVIWPKSLCRSSVFSATADVFSHFPVLSLSLTNEFTVSLFRIKTICL